ncbi:protein HEADING DATE 3B-like [Iris pallida]|uniref:Protein HEADING DATE 3B-like n=1 Tax=Iris pallida TaxID=29817 RepID=A0AAX6FHP4_IRIPA|nr:protein HEADING DATE 3B-like [Iris pallida]
MKGGGKDEGKAMEPLFPRLHVNDREKGGPRAPPRNKMALYEQLSIPSKRFSSSSSTLSPALDKAGSPPPPRPQSSGIQANGHGPFNMSPNPHSNPEDRIHSRLLERVSCNTTREDFGRSFKRHASNNNVNGGGSASAECTSRHLSRDVNGGGSASASDVKKSRENFEDEDDFTVPTFVQTVIAAFSSYDLPAVQPGKPTISHVERSQKRCSYPLPNCNEMPFKEKSTNTISRKSESEQNCKETSVFAHSPEIRDPRRPSELSNWNKTSLDRTGTVDVDKHASHANKELHLESCADGYPSGSRCSNRVDVVEEEDNSRNIIASCSKASLGEKADKFGQETHDESNRQPHLGDGDRDEVSEASMDYVAGMGMMISPDDVVGVIGTKHFWKARRAIVNQQRVFAIQVFELHRLIKVQKLIAASPDVIMTDLYVKPSPAKMVSENLPPEDVLELPPPLDNIGNSHQPTIEQNDSSQKLNPSTGCPEENPVRDPPQEDISRVGLHSVDSAPDNRTNAYCFHPPPNQWLVPVMSPSEGLIYKPYSGPCPPIPGFMAPPFYGGCAPHGFQPAGGDFMNSAYGALPYQPPPNYFPSFYSLPMEKPMFSSSAVEQVIPSAGSQPNVRELQQARSSCVVSHPSREAVSGRVRKFPAPKDSEVQGSTVSSSNPPREEDESPLFRKPGPFVAMDQASESCQGDGQNRVIKVVPHNAGSATESAARIFRSIQRERQQYRP